MPAIESIISSKKDVAATLHPGHGDVDTEGSVNGEGGLGKFKLAQALSHCLQGATVGPWKGARVFLQNCYVKPVCRDDFLGKSRTVFFDELDESSHCGI